MEPLGRSERPLRVLFVCTGNRCRSPVAEGVSRREAGGLPIEFSSAGLEGSGSLPSPPVTLSWARRAGLDLSHHRSRGVDELELAGFDLVVGFELDHVAVAGVELGAPPGCCFLLTEIVPLLERVPDMSAPAAADLARRRIDAATVLRQQHPTAISQIEDPMGRPEATHRAVYERIAHYCRRLVAGLFR